MPHPVSPRFSDRLGERGIASVILLFAMSAFSVLSVAALSTGLGSQPAGKTFSIFRSIPQEALTKFVASIVVPNDWKAEGSSGSYQFQLPVVVPEGGGADQGSSAAWHTMAEIPGMAVCCEARAGVCAERNEASGGARIVDWTPGSDDALRLSFDLASRPDPDASAGGRGDLVTATVRSGVSGTPSDAAAVSCQLEFEGAVIAKGTAMLRQAARDDDSTLPTPRVTGSMAFAVKTK